MSKQEIISKLPEKLQRFVRIPAEMDIPLADLERSYSYTTFRYLMGVPFFPYILFRNILVREKQLALIWENGTAKFYGPGRHALYSPTTRIDRIVHVNQPLIEHGDYTIARVENAQLGYGIETETGNPVILTPGKHIIISSTFRFKSFLDMTRPINKIGELSMIRVETGHIGYYYRNGELDLLHPGQLHLVSPPDRFGAIISTQQEVMDLGQSEHETSDYVKLTIEANLFYQIVDPMKALTRVKNIEKQLKEIAIATLAGILRSSTLSDIAQSSKPAFKTDEGILDQTFSFYQKVHDKFLQELHDYVVRDYGVDISNIRIESLKIKDKKLNDDIAQQAVTVAQLEVDYKMLQKKREITETQASIQANASRIKAEGEANAKTKTADGEASYIVKLAEANKKAKILSGESEKEYAELIGSTQHGFNLAQLSMQKDALSRMNQVAYLPEGCIPKLLTQGMFAQPQPGLPEVTQAN